MRVLLLGAGGFIGRHTEAALRAAGHDVLVRRPDWQQADQPAVWRPLLAGIDAAIYLPGTLRDRAHGRNGWLDLLHHRAPLALLQAGVPRLVHVSALCGGTSAYARSKQAGDDALRQAARASGQTLHIVRPSMVLGDGGVTSGMLAGLARLPWLALPRLMRGCRLQPVRVEDLADTLVALLARPGTDHLTLDAVGTDIDTMPGWVARRRASQGRRPARICWLPNLLATLSARIGDWLPFGSWNRQTLALLRHDSVAPGSTALARLLGRPLRGALDGPW